MRKPEEPPRALSGVKIVHSDRPVVKSPSGLPTQHLVCEETGSSSIFVGQQWLEPGERVYRHSHPCEESVTFLSGAGEASMGDETVPISAGTTLFFPTGLLHGFRNIGTETMHVIVVFPVPYFAPTDIVEER